MKTKFLLPVVAIIFAVGMAFASANKVSNPNTDYILENGTFHSIEMELNCTLGTKTCRVQFVQNGPVYDVYDAEDPNSLKSGNGTVTRLWQ